MKTKKNQKSLGIPQIYGWILVLLFIVPYTILLVFDSWQIRWIFGLLLWIAVPIMLLSIALNPKIRLNPFNSDKPPANPKSFGYLKSFSRLLLIVISIATLYGKSIPYMYASFRLGFSGWRLEKVTGIIKQSRSSGRAGIISRDIEMEGIDRDFQLMYPLGKRHHPGQQCELLLLPGTHIAVDLKVIQNFPDGL